MRKTRKWEFKTRFRNKAYGWRGDRLAIKRLKEAVSEIRKAGKSDAAAAADGAIELMERLWPALQQVDGSSGALGNAVHLTLESLIPILIATPSNLETRQKWMERLFEAICDDGVQYLAPVEDRWGEICQFPELANQWADRILPVLREARQTDGRAGWIDGSTLCLSCLLETKRYQELEDLLSLKSYSFWHFDKFQAEALARERRVDEAVAYAESRRKDSHDNHLIVTFCERILLESGRREEAYRLYGLKSVSGSTNLSVFRQTAKKYPEKDPRQVLLDLIESRGDKGKWFAAAKSANLLDIALECAATGDTEPATLIRAARGFLDANPNFSAEVSLHGIRTLLQGRGYEPSTLDMIKAYESLMDAAERLGAKEQSRRRVEKMLTGGVVGCDESMRKALENCLEGKTLPPGLL